MREEKALNKECKLVKFYKLDAMQEYKMLASKFLNKKEISQKEFDNLELDYDFIEFYQNNIVQNEDLAKEIYKETFDIVDSRESEHGEQNSKEWRSRIKNLFDFDGEISSNVYVLKYENKPVAFALFSCRNPMAKSWNLELVYSHSDYSSYGFGEKLLKQCFKELHAQGEREVISIVERKNKASIAMHQKLDKDFACNTYVEEKTGNLVFDFNIEQELSNDMSL